MGAEHDHETSHDPKHDHGSKPEKPAETRPAEDGGTACQLDLGVLLPGDANGGARFQKLEQTLRARRGIGEVHVRKEREPPEVCVHYDPAQVTLPQVLALVRSEGAEVVDRYRQKTWAVRGMDCAQCAPVIEHAVQRVGGVLSARATYAGGRLVVEYDNKATDLGEVERRVRALGFTLDAPDEKEGGGDGHAHGSEPALEIPLVIASGVLLAVAYALGRLAPGTAPLPTVLYALSAAAGGAYTARDAVNALRQRRFDIETLMFLAAVGAAAVGAWFEGALLLFLFSLGHALEHLAMERTKRAVEALGKLRPETARVRRDGGLVEVPVGEVQPGTRVVVRPGDRVPLDGVVREGQSALDQAAITGESVPVSRGPGDPVFAGTINTEAAIEVEVTKAASDSALARVMALVAEAESQKSPTQRLTQRIERRVVPLVLAAAPLVMIVRHRAPCTPTVPPPSSLYTDRPAPCSPSSLYTDRPATELPVHRPSRPVPPSSLYTDRPAREHPPAAVVMRRKAPGVPTGVEVETPLVCLSPGFIVPPPSSIQRVSANRSRPRAAGHRGGGPGGQSRPMKSACAAHCPATGTRW